MQRLCFSPADTFQLVQHLCAAEIFPAAAAACGPSPSPPPPPPLFLLLLLLHSSRRQDGQGALQSAPRVQQTQLFPVGPRRLVVEEAREDRVAQPRLRLPRFGGQPGSRAGEQHESAAAGAQEAAGRSAEQIHQPDPGLAEQVSTRRGGGETLWPLVSRLHVVICPVHVALLPPRHCEGEEEEEG